MRLNPQIIRSERSVILRNLKIFFGNCGLLEHLSVLPDEYRLKHRSFSKDDLEGLIDFAIKLLDIRSFTISFERFDVHRSYIDDGLIMYLEEISEFYQKLYKKLTKGLVRNYNCSAVCANENSDPFVGICFTNRNGISVPFSVVQTTKVYDKTNLIISDAVNNGDVLNILGVVSHTKSDNFIVFPERTGIVYSICDSILSQ